MSTRQYGVPGLFGTGFMLLCLSLVLGSKERSALAATAATHGHTSKKTMEPLSPVDLLFSGELTRVDLSHHPMTLTVVLGRADPLHFVLEGLLIPDTVVLSDGKSVGVNALKPGQILTIRYRITAKGPEIRQVLLHSRKESMQPPRIQDRSARPRSQKPGIAPESRS